MRYKFLTAAIGLAVGAAIVPLSATSANAADPTGYWRKAEQGKRPAKQQIYRCGSRAICVKIVWLKNPLDSNGKPLHDVRNSNPKLRGRTIEGLQIVRGMAQVSGNQWKGNIYNPEDGNTYSATITMVSKNKLILKGCKASIFCRSQEWLRASAPPPKEVEIEEKQIEASVEPGQPAPAIAAAATGSSAFAGAELARPSSARGSLEGSRYLHPTSGPVHHKGFSGESLSSMFSMSTPLKNNNAQQAAQGSLSAAAPSAVARSAPAQQALPRASVSATPESAVTPQGQPGIASAQAEAAEPEATGTVPQAQERLTWRERRQLRRQKRLRELQAQGEGAIPWLR